MENNLIFELTKEQQNLINKICPLNEGLYSIKNNFLYVSEENKNKIIDLLNNYFNKSGLQSDYEPNPLGIKLEELIDLFLND